MTIIQYTIVIFFKKNLNHIGDLFENNCKMRSWEDLRSKLDLDYNKKFHWRQIIHVVPCVWKEMFLECGNNISDLIISKHHLIKKHNTYCLEKLNSRVLYNMQNILKVEKPINYSSKIFPEKISKPWIGMERYIYLTEACID